MAKIKEFVKNNILVILLILAIVLVSLTLILVFSLTKEEGKVAKVIYYDQVIEEIDLDNVNGTIQKDIYLTNDLFITVEIKKGAIRVIKADCKHQDCVRMGWTNSPSKPIICLDLHYKIVLSGESDVDVVIK